MGYREVHRMEIGEVIRRWQMGESQRAIAQALGLSRDTVAKYLRADSGSRRAARRPTGRPGSGPSTGQHESS